MKRVEWKKHSALLLETVFLLEINTGFCPLAGSVLSWDGENNYSENQE
jgi:hypothetical protein